MTWEGPSGVDSRAVLKLILMISQYRDPCDPLSINSRVGHVASSLVGFRWPEPVIPRLGVESMNEMSLLPITVGGRQGKTPL